MRCLGVPNTAHFANVTLIEDAVARQYCRCHVELLAVISVTGRVSIDPALVYVVSQGALSPILPLLSSLPNPPFRLPLCNFIASPLVAPLHAVYNATHTHNRFVALFPGPPG